MNQSSKPLQSVPQDPFSRARIWKVYAGAGSGKTKTISDTIEFLIEQKHVRPEEIMYVLFNRKPAMAFRAMWAKRGLTQTEMRYWGTHHALAKNLLKLKNENIITDLEEWGKEHGFDLHNDPFNSDTGLDLFGWDATMSSLQKKIYELAPGLDKDEQRLLNALKKSEVDDNKYCHMRYLEKSIHMRLFPSEVKYVFADEAQDNSPLQHLWLQQIVDNPDVLGIMLAGDDKQAINKFRGADPQLFLDFKADAEVNLPATWRCSANILKEANGVIKPVRNRSALTVKSMQPMPGKVELVAQFTDTFDDIIKALNNKKSVMILARNRCFLNKAEHLLNDAGIIVQSDWSDRLKLTVSGLASMRKTNQITEESLAAVLPDKTPKRGQLKKLSYWHKGVVDKLRTGEGLMDDPDLYEAYGELRLGQTIPLADAERLGFTKEFLRDIAIWKMPDDKWFLPSDKILAFKTAIRNFGFKFGSVRIDTIHSAKGEEADVVVLLTDVTDSVSTAEWNDEDAERRVWYVGETRAKETLILTSLSFNKNSIIV